MKTLNGASVFRNHVPRRDLYNVRRFPDAAYEVRQIKNIGGLRVDQLVEPFSVIGG
jgi:hypothetical protein